jgi:hypothetical protein
MHIDHLTTKLSTVCYIIRPIRPLTSHKKITIDLALSFSYSQELGITFWRKSCHSIQIFWMQKRVMKIIMVCGNRDSHRIILKKLKILPLMSQYILSLRIFLVNNRDQFLINSEIHNINIRHSYNLHLPSVNLDIYQMGVHYSDIKIFNSLPFNIKKIFQ